MFFRQLGDGFIAVVLFQVDFGVCAAFLARLFSPRVNACRFRFFRRFGKGKEP